MQKKYRLLKKNEFQVILKNKKKIDSKLLSLYYRSDNSLQNVKLGILIPKKKCNSAVKRNYLRRVLKAAVQSNPVIKLFPIKCVLFFNFNNLVFIRKNKISFDKVTKDLNDICSKLLRIH